MFFKCDECGERFFLPTGLMRCRVKHANERAKIREENRRRLEQSRHRFKLDRPPHHTPASQATRRDDDSDDLDGFTDLRGTRAPSIITTQHHCSREDRHETTDSSSGVDSDCSSDD